MLVTNGAKLLIAEMMSNSYPCLTQPWGTFGTTEVELLTTF